jgi:hypothetical protein
MQPKIEDVVAKLRTLPPERIEEVADFVDFLKQRATAKKANKREPLDFPVISVGQWPEGLSLRREDMYGDDGR